MRSRSIPPGSELSYCPVHPRCRCCPLLTRVVVSRVVVVVAGWRHRSACVQWLRVSFTASPAPHFLSSQGHQSPEHRRKEKAEHSTVPSFERDHIHVSCYSTLS